MHVHVNAAVALIRLHLYETIQCLSYYYKTSLKFFLAVFKIWNDRLFSVQFARQIKLPGSNMLLQYTQTLFYNTL